MVFNTLQKTLTSFSEKVTDKMAHPIDTVSKAGKSVKKTVLGPDTNLTEQVEEKLKYVPLMKVFEQQTKKFTNKVKRSKIAKTKKNKLVAAVDIINYQIKTITNFEKATKTIKMIFLAFEKTLKEKKIPTNRTGKSWQTDKIKLTTTDTNFLLTEFQEFQIEINGTIEDLSKPFYEQYLLPISMTYHHEEEKEDFQKIWKQKIDQLINDEYEITKTQKNLLYLVEAYEKQQKIIESALADKRKGVNNSNIARRITTSKNKIKTMLQTDIPKGLKTLDIQVKKIITDEKTIKSKRNIYRKTYKSRQTELSKWSAANRVETQRKVGINNKASESSEKTRTLTTNKITSLHTKIQKLVQHLQSSTQAEEAKKLFHEEQEFNDSYLDQILLFLALYTQKVKYHLKDMSIYDFSAKNHSTYLYDTLALEKGRILQLKILLNIKKRHYDLSNKIWHKLLEASTHTEEKFDTLINRCKRHFDNFQQQRKAYEQEIGSQNKFIQKQRKEIKEVQQVQRTITFIKERLQEKNTSYLSSYYAGSLKTLQTWGKEYIISLEKTVDTSKKRLDIMNQEQEERKKEENLTTNKKRIIAKEENNIHEHELYLDALEHYIAHAQEENNDDTTLIKYYNKEAKSSKQKMNFYEKQIKNLLKKIKKHKGYKASIKDPTQLIGLN